MGVSMDERDRRRERVAALVRAEPAIAGDLPAPVGRLQRLCRSAALHLRATGVGVSVLAEEGCVLTAASSPAIARLEELQVTLGDGPCREAFERGRPVLVSDLDAERPSRWPAFAAEARRQGLRAMFAFPLQVGAARLGCLDVYRDQPGPLSREARTDAMVYADLGRDGLLDAQDQAMGPDGPTAFDDLDGSQFDVYQAQGMVMVQLGVSLGEAMARLRAHAFAHERGLGEVARDVIARRLVFERDAT